MNLQDFNSLAFGPVPSRRLGRSLGINNIRPKTCSYSCIYCQLGNTTQNTIERQFFHKSYNILREVEKRVNSVFMKNERIDYLTYVPDGEPTLDSNIGEEIRLLKPLGIPIAVLTNASMLWMKNVREDLLRADYVSLKVDAVTEDLWKKVDRPNKNLSLNTILQGIQDFAEVFKGTIVTETMLVHGIDYTNEFERIAAFLANLKKLNRAYIAVPTRPPTENWVKPATEEVINAAFQVFSEKLGVDRVEYLLGFEGDAFSVTGNVEEDLLNIMAVHPMREQTIKERLSKGKANWQVIEKLLREEKLLELEFEGHKYYLRKLVSRD